MPCSARMGTHCFRISAWGVGEAATFRVTVSWGSAGCSVCASSVVSALAESSDLLPQAVRDRASVRASRVAKSCFSCSFPPMNIRIDEFYISSACRNTLVHIGGQAMKTNEMRGTYLVWARRESRSKAVSLPAPVSSRLSIFLDSQPNRDWTICTMMIRMTTVTHITSVMNRW